LGTLEVQRKGRHQKTQKREREKDKWKRKGPVKRHRQGKNVVQERKLKKLTREMKDRRRMGEKERCEG